MNNLDIIKDLCKEKGISISKLEKTLNIGNGAIAKSTSNYMRSDRLKAIADYFGVTMEYLMTGKDQEWEAATPAEIEFFEKDAATPHPVTDQERELLRRFVLLDQSDKGKLSAYLDGLLAAEKYDKKELFA